MLLKNATNLSHPNQLNLIESSLIKRGPTQITPLTQLGRITFVPNPVRPNLHLKLLNKQIHFIFPFSFSSSHNFFTHETKKNSKSIEIEEIKFSNHEQHWNRLRSIRHYLLSRWSRFPDRICCQSCRQQWVGFIYTTFLIKFWFFIHLLSIFCDINNGFWLFLDLELWVLKQLNFYFQVFIEFFDFEFIFCRLVQLLIVGFSCFKNWNEGFQ